MKKKFFSLINGGAVHVAPNTKVIPAKEFSTLLEAAEMLDLVQEDARAFKMTECEDEELLKQEAQKEGYEEGFKAWAKALTDLEAEIENVRAEMEQLVIPIALKAAKKIVGREIELSEDTIVDIVSASLKAVSQHKKVAIYVNKKELAILEANRPRLKELFENLESLSLRERADIPSGGCVIETEVGIINAQLDNQWRILEKAFEKLPKYTPPDLKK